MAHLRALTLLLAGLGKFCLSLLPTDFAQFSELANTTAHTSRNPPLVAKQAKLALKQPDESDSCHRQCFFNHPPSCASSFQMLSPGTSPDVSQTLKDLGDIPSGTPGYLKFKTRFLFSVEL